MEFGVQTRGSFAHLLGIAQWADRAGLACFAVPDHFLTSRRDSSQAAYDNLTMLAALARETERIRLATLVSPITFRHPAVMAKAAVTIDELSGGRLTLGVGTGWLELEHEVFGLPFPPSAERWERMEDALGYLRAAFAPGAVGFDGTHYRLQEMGIGPTPSDGLQLIVGGTGPQRTPTLAGRYADEYNGYPEPRDEMRRRIEVARQAAAGAGRDPDALLVSTSGLLVVGRDQAEYRRRLLRIAELVNESPDEMEQGWQRRDAPHGTPEQALHLLGTLEEAGVQRFYVQSVGDRDAAEFEDLLGLAGAPGPG